MARVDRGLAVVIAEWKARHPGALVGTQGDDHHTPPSDHLPDEADTIDAGDFMVGNGVTDADLDDLAARLIASRDPRIAYVIRRQTIVSSTVRPWEKRPYPGAYHGHVHLSVNERHADDTTPWELFPMTPAEIEAVATATADKILTSTLGRSTVTVAVALQRTEAAIAPAAAAQQALQLGVTTVGKQVSAMHSDLSAARTVLGITREAVGLVPTVTADVVLARLGEHGDPASIAALLRQVPNVDWSAVGRELNG